ncbi:MAG: M23 family metallopeptidase [Elusimicrobia bacterium]|nr:M23 family metallopeptidase [Elusimicrobiota bacterium]
MISCSQGDTLKVELGDFNAKLDYRAEFMGKDYAVLQADGSCRCYIGIPADAAPGNYYLKITEKKKKKTVSISNIVVDIAMKEFPAENLVFTPDKKSIMAQDNSGERETIGGAVANETPCGMWTSSFSMPVQGRISSAFGAVRKSGSVVLWRHKGIDISAKSGTEIKAPESGRTILVNGDFIFHGKTVVLDHGLGITSIYMHMEEISVTEGQVLKKGDRIGTVGNTGLSTASHLHWGIYVHGIPVDPVWWTENR